MPVPHFNIKITQRSKGNSAVAGAAYQAGEKLFSEYDQKTKNYTCKKEVVYTEIMLPPNAPPEYADRATLWNSVEEIEKQWNSQLARRFVAALPREVPMELLPQMVKEYCEEQFVSKGMCCDFAIHDPDPPGHNPHCHFMLTMRAIDENGKWMPKSRKVYDLDENGERIKLPSGRWKSHKEDTVDWNEQYHAEEWRHGWEIVQNKYLELAGSPERIDMRSYERQGLDIIPTVHMGTAVSALERKGIATNIGNLNRDIKAANRMMNAIRSTIKWYARDISKKRRISNKIKGNAGEPMGQPPYGYIKDPENPKRWIVDEEAAQVVRRIYRMTLEGVGTEQIAAKLEEDGVLTPRAYWQSKGINRPGKVKDLPPTHWNSSSVIKMLSVQEYCGDILNFKTYSKSYKNKKRLENDRENWAIFKDVHEPIIERAVFEQVQQKRGKMRKRQAKDGERSMFSGLLVCADCGSNLPLTAARMADTIKSGGKSEEK